MSEVDVYFHDTKLIKKYYTKQELYLQKSY